MSYPLSKASILCAVFVGMSAVTGTGFARAETPVGQAVTTPADAAAVRALIDTMHFDKVIDLLRVEGLDYGASIEDELFPDAGGPGWKAAVSRIYDTQQMNGSFTEKMVSELSGKGDEVRQMTTFFASPLGQKVLSLELEARRSLMDDDTESAAGLAWSDLAAEGGARAEKLQEFARINDLVDSNVMGTLNANLAFYQGMAGTGAFSGEMSEDEMLSDVWAQEPDIRRQTEDWVYPFLNLAYSSLEDDDLDRYLEFSRSDAGQVMNAALFAAFDAVFVPMSRALGAAAALQIKGQDI